MGLTPPPSELHAGRWIPWWTLTFRSLFHRREVQPEVSQAQRRWLEQVVAVVNSNIKVEFFAWGLRSERGHVHRAHLARVRYTHGRRCSNTKFPLPPSFLLQPTRFFRLHQTGGGGLEGVWHGMGA